MSNRTANSAFLLESLLARQTKAQLTNLCRRLQVKGASGLRKSKLIGLLCQRLPGIIAGKMLCWDQQIYGLVQEIATLSQVHRLDAVRSTPAEDYLLEEFVAFLDTDDDATYPIIPLEIQELFFALDGPSYRERVRENTEIARLSRGILHYYGCLSWQELGRILTSLLPRPVDRTRIGQILKEIGPYHWKVIFDQGYFCDGRLTDLGYVLKELQGRKGLDYRPLTYHQAWQAGDPSFYHKCTRQLRELRSFLRKHQLDDESAPYFTDLLFSLVQTDLSPPEIVYALLEHMELTSEADFTELTLVVFDFYHSAPHWVLKGYSPEEIMDGTALETKPAAADHHRRAVVYDFFTRRPMSPEAPCPCGSKLNFGRCCGSA
ncbi:MAG TPA: SEC-C domain-containing protein [Limnochordia bacterium]|mgnify:CR=1 FL=1|nr:SEC-C domain-containing protein [Limnochordia bacterium]